MKQTAASHEFPCETCAVRDDAICGVLTNEELIELNAITTSVNLSPDECESRRQNGPQYRSDDLTDAE